MRKILYNRIKLLAIPVLISIVVSSCKKFLDVGTPKSELETDVVFSNDVTATSAVMGIYMQLIESDGFINGNKNSVSYLTGLSSDELVNYPRNLELVEFENNALKAPNNSVFTLWNIMYKIIYQANAAIEGIDESAGMSAAASKQLKGEALFLRALSHFYLVNLYGDVPLVTTTDYEANALMTRTGQNAVYEQMITDLETARTLLGDAYRLDPERLCANKFTAEALLARVYLYHENWQKAEEMASEVIAHEQLYKLTDSVKSIFLKNSTEAIFQLRPIFVPYTYEGLTFSPRYILSNNVMRPGFQDDFETGDRRVKGWIEYMEGENSDTVYFPRKYKEAYSGVEYSEYSTVLRLAEQYLIRAEARAMQNKLTGQNSAASDIDHIRHRAGLLPTTATTQAGLLDAILKERKIELIAEGGHRWMDLKRLGKADEVLAPIKGASWQPTDVLFPLPEREMIDNPKLRPQNKGY